MRHCFLISLLLVLALCSGTTVCSQSRVEGFVFGTDNQPLAGASVSLLLEKDSSLVKGSLTTPRGRYVLDQVAPGTYRIAVSYTGLKQVYSPAFSIAKAEHREVAAVTLLEKAAALQELTLVAKRPLFEQKVDRMVINVSNNITAAGSTVLDVLERSPGIVVDRQNNALSINGKDGVVVMINGKINRMPISSLVQMLAAMPSDNVERVEVITTPPANFDAEGNAGYVNIVLKRNLQFGTNGSYTLTAGYSRGPITTASGNINYRASRWNVYGNYAYNRTDTKQWAYFSYAVTSNGRFIENIGQSERNPVEPVHDLKAGADYEIKKDVIAGVLVSLYNRGWSMPANNNARVFVNGVLDTVATVSTKEEHPMHSYDINANLQRNFKEGKLSVNVDYLDYRETNPVNYINTYYNGMNQFLFEDQVRSDKHTPVKVWVGAIDHEAKLAKATLTTGLKGTLSRFTNVVQVDKLLAAGWMADPALSATYYLNESIAAAYAALDWSMDSKTTAKAGLRWEYTNSTLDTKAQKNIVDRHYGRLFPSLFLSQVINEQNAVNLAYSRRITRPTFWNLAPFVIFMDPNTFFSGNPGLQPAVSDNLTFSYTFHKKIVSLSYSYENSPITNFSPHVDPVTNKETLSAENQKDRRSLNLSFSLPFEWTAWWSMQVNINAAYQKLNGLYNKETVVLTQQNFFANTIQNFKLPKEWTVSLSGFYSSPSLFGLYKTDPLGLVDLGVQKKLRDQKSSLRFNYGNIFNTMKPHFAVNLPEKNLIAAGEINFNHPSFRFTFTHNFGSDQVKAKRNRSTGAEEEKDRLKM